MFRMNQHFNRSLLSVALKMWTELVLFAVTACICSGEDSASRLVHIKQGPVVGHKDPNTGVYMFPSIPYATSPTGTHRFEAPLPPPKWTEPLNAHKQIVCHQVDNSFVKNKLMQEDCLIANVYVSETDKDFVGGLPVIVYVLGGAFEIGFGDMVPPTRFIKGKNLVAVTFNYRLGINGFLCLGTKGAPGNVGLKDQVALLRWVKENIAAFGGNRDDVTIAGGSAGSVSVDLLMISNSADGLFNKVIPESGAATGYIAMQMDPVGMTKNYAKTLGFDDVDDIFALEKFLKSVPVEEFYKGTGKFMNVNSTLDFLPCVERRQYNEDVFIDDAPINIIKKGDYTKVPMLFGFAEMEDIIYLENFSLWKSKMNENFSNVLPPDLQFNSDDEKEKVAETIKQFYFGEKDVTEESILPFIDYFTDTLFAYPTLRSVRSYVESGHDQIYLYEYSFTDEDTPVVPGTNVRGANHCAQTLTVLDARQMLNPLDVKISEEYKNIQNVVQEMWHNFIVTGRPVPSGSDLPAWPAVGADWAPHMSLDRELRLRRPLLERRAKFWERIYEKHYRQPTSPPAPPPRPRNEEL